MDPMVREERVATRTGATPVVPAGEPAVERGFPIQPAQTSVPASPAAAAPVVAAPVAAVPAAAAPVAPVAPVALAPAAPVAGTTVYSSRVGLYPVGYRTIQLIWLIAGVVDLILALDFIFRAANANNTGFAHYTYRLGGWLAAPFNGIFTNTTSSNGTVLRWGDVLAIVIYTVAAWIITRLVRISSTPRTGVNRV
jgi:hypothetical protein